MTASTDKPVLYVAACGGRPAGDLPTFVASLVERGWEVCVIATPSALKFISLPALERMSGHVVRYEYKQPDESDVLPPADAVAVAPATFNTINKWAFGSSDTLALGILNEAIGLDLPIVAVPVPKVALARHPRFSRKCRAATSLGCTTYLRSQALPVANAKYGAIGGGLVSVGRLARTS